MANSPRHPDEGSDGPPSSAEGNRFQAREHGFGFYRAKPVDSTALEKQQAGAEVTNFVSIARGAAPAE
jgi:hypothetical protein